MTPTDLFHAHLSECQQCRDNPRDLCMLGQDLGQEMVAEMVEQWKEQQGAKS